MSRSYKLGYAVGTVVLFAVAVLLIGLAPVALFWLVLVVCVVGLLRRRHVRA